MITDTPDFPALVELASRLKGKDKKTCALALYTLKKQDERIDKRNARIAALEAALIRIGHPGKQVVYCRDGHEESALLARAALEGKE